MNEYHIRPAEFMAMDIWEKAYIMAAADIITKQRKKAAKEAKKRQKGGKR